MAAYEILDAPGGSVINIIIVTHDTTAEEEAYLNDTYGSGFWRLAPDPPAPPITMAQVDAERDRRKHLDLTFDVDTNSKVFQADRASQIHMHEAAVWALKAVEAGAVVDDYRWNSNTEDFQWILADNSLLLMDAHEMIALWAEVSKRNTQLQLKGRALKDMSPIPMNYTDNSFWE